MCTLQEDEILHQQAGGASSIAHDTTTLDAAWPIPDHASLSAGAASIRNGSTKLQQLVAMKLSNRPEVMYPAHGFGRGGIGVFLATGASRAGTAKLPQARKAGAGTITARTLSAGSATNTSISQRPWTTSTTTFSDAASRQQQQRASTAATTTLSRGSTRGSGQSAATSGMGKPWEQVVPHPHNFMPAARSARTHDVPPGHRWAAMSFYENDPAEIKRHLDITGQLDQLHASGKLEEHAQDQRRRNAWAAAQRSMFRRQRQEVAMRYQSLNLPLRPTHQWVLSEEQQQPAAEQQQGGDAAEELGGHVAAPPPSVPLPKPTYVKVYDRMAHEIEESPRLKEEQWARARQSARLSKQKAELDAEVAALDGFEDFLQAVQRQRARSQYAPDE